MEKECKNKSGGRRGENTPNKTTTNGQKKNIGLRANLENGILQSKMLVNS